VVLRVTSLPCPRLGYLIMFHPWKLLIIAFTTSTERTEALLILASCVGGGVLLLIHKSFWVFQLNLDHIIAHLPIIDIIGCKVVLNSQSFVFVFVIYIPPQTSVDDFATLMEFLEVLDYLYEHDVLFIGDFNVPNFINNNGCRIDSKNELLLNFCSILNLK
jgi:biotin transporter BioY